ncbi:MAG: acyltransferase domain-containing protein [Candidatus Poseidoniales archaeon]|nr:MAG: acyltransferase domain-containing protein [Candidatus Poseidoniales archaeon]
MTLTTADGKPCEGIEQGPFEPIAVIGLGALMPDAHDIDAFWQNILDAKVSIRPLPDGRWPGPVDHFWKEGGPGEHTEGYTYAKIGALVSDAEFDWRRWRQPPGTLPQIDPCQLWAVSVSADAIEHAGYDGESNDIDRTKTGVVFANALGGENRNLSNLRVWSNHTTALAKEHGLPEANVDGFTEAVLEGAPRVDEDTMPGELANVVSGRVANLLDLQGPNHAMDAACASSMAAVLDACRLLQTRQVDVMLAGATDRTMDPATFAKFSAIGALSPTHSSPFDARANGFVMGEGAGVLVLKRLSDAIRDDDEIYSVIRGIGGSSDGRGKGITAPSQRGQIQAIARAYNQAGYPASSVELVEAHGTSTKVGDATELSTLSRLWTGVEGTGNVAVGSIKSQIGHLKAAAGIAGIMKSVMALHHRTIPPSANFETPNPTVDWSNIPFFVPTAPMEWPRPASNPRRAGVSAFGFGGTNFHIALEGYEPDYHAPLASEWDARWSAYSGQAAQEAPSIFDPTLPATMSHEAMKAIEGGVLLLSDDSLESLQTQLANLSFDGPLFDDDPKGRRLSEALQTASNAFEPAQPIRMALVATSWAEFAKRQTLAGQAMMDSEKWGFLQAQGVLLTDQPAMPSKAKTVHMYPGQGSQYVGMTADLVQRFTAPADVWEQADETMVEVLNGETLSGFVLRSSLSKDELKEAEHKLKQTEYTQPAMLTADLAIERTLQAYGHSPDMVAGHSLGEYAALMSSGILDMDGALRAAAARGTEMGAVEIDDKGLMASVTAPYSAVEAVLEATDGYVIAANKNSPKMTVIAGETEPVKAAMAMFEEQGFSCVALATSHAFHSRIVAPANEPLRRFLEELDIRWPEVPITANVDGTFYPVDGEDSKAAILEKLAPQMASSVEWTKQIETMYAAGGRLFVEVGPKRALTMFAMQILEGQPHVPIMTNHPKQGGIASFMTAIGALALAGRPPMWPSLDSDALQDAFKAGPIEARALTTLSPSTSTAALESLRTRARPLPGSGVASAPMNAVAAPVQTGPLDSDFARDRAIKAYVGDRIAAYSGYPASFCHGHVPLTTGLGLSTEQVQRVVATIASEAQTDPEFDGAAAVTAGDLTRWVRTPPSSWSPMATVSAPPSLKMAPVQTVSMLQSGHRRDADPYVVTGVSLGLPGMDQVFSEDAFEKLVRGETCISEVSDEYKQRLLDKNIVRLIKGRDGSVNMDQAKVFGDIPQLAGLKGAFDLAEEFGIDPKAIVAWDISTQLAVAAGLLALRDAGIPLTPVEQVGKGGLRLIRNWQVPQIQRERTGIVFSSCFPGLQMASKHAKNNGDDGEGRFDRRYLFQTLNMGHSQFAQYTGIRGPNTTINLACASATAAFGVAEDWLDAGRVDRVVIISGDDVTGDDLWEWIAGGFAASGAAATNNVVEETALPFDRRRNGLILGMGAAAFVVERNSEAQQRGVQPIAEFLGSTTANSAYHGTRLDVEHVGQVVNGFITDMERRWGLDRHAMAPNTVFFSHETYTPARGGSAQSEVKALRDTFGDSTNKLVIANTKGFTGHPMAVGIEDASMFYGLKTRRIPPIANHKEKDPELGDLNLSTGGDYPELEYGLRFAAGFGSQIALSLMRRWPVEGDRIDGARLLAWARGLAGTDDVVMRILQNKLVAYVDGENNLHGGIQGEPWPATASWEGKPSVSAVAAPAAPAPAPEMKPSPAVAPPVPAASSVAVDDESMVATVIEVVVNHTGYPADFVELDQDLEGELGIDTVKQAEIMADIRDRFDLPVDEDFVLADYPTLSHMIGYIQRMKGGVSASPAPVEASPEVKAVSPEPAPSPAPAPAPAAKVDDAAMTATVVAVVVEHTGYPADFIELDQDLEGELGIDTVKQAEIMADIRDKFSLPIDEDFVLADHPTLNHMIGYIQRMQGGAPAASPATPVASPPPAAPEAPSPAVVPSPAPSVPSEGQSHPDIEQVLVSVVVDHTGYPADFIEMDQDLEGELGIDTVKQAEIMAEIRDRFSLPVDEDFVLADHPTLNHFTAYIVKMQGGGSVQAPAAEATVSSSQAAGPAPSSSVPDGTRRWQVEIEGCPGIPSSLHPEGTVVVSDDGWGIAEAFCQRMEARGLKAVRVGFESRIRDASSQDEGGRTVYRVDPEQPEHLAWVATQLRDVQLAGMVHMAPMKLASEQWPEDTYPSSQIALAAHGWFGLLKELSGQIPADSSGFIASVSALDGRHGNKGDRFNALQCAASGVTKSFAFERPDLRCRALDLHPEFVLEASEAAERIENDVFELDGEVEIGLDRDGRRWALVAFAEDVVEDLQPLAGDDTWLVSGGGSGVTAASVIGVARASPKAGAHFELLGRSTLIESTASWVDWTEEQLSDEKNALRERLIDASETGKVTMVEWNQAWQRFTRSRDVYLTLDAITKTGNHATYHSIDVMDSEALAGLGASLGRPITGLVHGAGLEDSKLVADKAYDVFDRVVRVKIDGWRALMSAVHASGREAPDFACCFTSVAGRFGNGGQTDYAAANSVLDAEMARLTATTTCRAVAIGWTGWRDVGMATRGSIEAVFAAAGIETLAVEDGVSIFVAEALQGGKRRVLGCGSLGMMDRFGSFREAPLKLPPSMAATMADPSRFPFIDKVLSLQEGQQLVTQTTLSEADHPFLTDHAIEGVPYHPGVMAMEMFAQSALLLRPSTCLAGFEEVRFGLPVKLLKGSMTVRVEAEVVRSEDDMTWVRCRLVSDLSKSTGEVFGEREHHAALVRLVEKCEDLCPFLQREVDELPSIGTPPQGDVIHPASFIYDRYFHGPRFQSHGGVLRGVGEGDRKGIDGRALMRHQLPATDQFSSETEGEQVLLEALPMLIEAGFQNAGLVAMELLGYSSLPVGINWSTMLRVPDADETLRLRSLQIDSPGDGITVHDVLIVGEDDAPVLALKGLQLKAMATVDENQRFSLER